MRKSTVLLAIGITACALATAAAFADQNIQFLGTPSKWSKSVFLNTDDALARLQQSNPRHYAIARRILAAANEICDAAKTDVIPVKFAGQDVFCAQGFWLTSNPPKRHLQFQIDDTRYLALVTVPDKGAKLEPAH
jgi:hypothetical protein